ncbi:MAG: DUF1839 family protein [Acidimicrobiales bacterium]
MRRQVLALDPARYAPHRLHGADRNWTETNCWLDMMVEVLHVLGYEPLAAAAGTLSADFDGEQWPLFKFATEDLRALFGIEIDEMYVWRPVLDHIEDHLGMGQLVTVEVDAWFLPDTAGITYGTDHAKTGVVVQMVDRDERRLGYFHNAGYFELQGDDFDGIFHRPGGRDPRILLPYMELVRLDRRRHDPPGVVLDRARALTVAHLARRPADNPVVRLGARMESDLAWVAAGGDAAFHPYAFATCRQVGATAELAAAFVEWLDAGDGGGLEKAAAAFGSMAERAKGLQFSLARAGRGRRVDLGGQVAEMAEAWETAMAVMVARYGS